MSKYFDGYASFDYKEMSTEKLIVELKEKVRYIGQIKREHQEEISSIQSTKDKQIKELQDQLALTEKALELACERVKYFEEMQDKEMGFSEFFGYDSDYDLQAIIEQYKEQAKEMIKSE